MILSILSFFCNKLVSSILKSKYFWTVTGLRDESSYRTEWSNWHDAKRTLVQYERFVWGPRWNTHADLFSSWLKTPASSCTFVIDDSLNKAEWWAINFLDCNLNVLYSINSQMQQSTFDLLFIENKCALVNARVYKPSDGVLLPELLNRDGDILLKSTHFSQDQLKCRHEFYHSLFQKRDRFIFKMPMLYVNSLLTLNMPWLDSFVHKEFLPVGNPTTVFIYGVVKKGNRLIVTTAANAILQGILNITIYNICSIPTLWDVDIIDQTFETIVQSDGFFLLRYNAKHRQNAHLAQTITVQADRVNAICPTSYRKLQQQINS